MIYDSQTRKYDVVILGAGAAGLMAGLTAGFRGRSVLILECSNMVGKKILLSGGGRCNFTNQYIDYDNFLSDNSHFCIGALNGYTANDFIQMVDRHNIQYEIRKHNQLFCINSSSDILEMLLAECSMAKVDIETHSKVDSISYLEPQNENDKDDQYRYMLNSEYNGKKQRVRSDKISCKSLIIATGGLSVPTLGGSGFGYDLAKNFSLDITNLSAGLVPFTFSGNIQMMVKRLSGVSTYVNVTCNGKTFREHILFTHRGLSGPAILQISNYWKAGQSISIDLFPDQNLTDLLLKQKEKQSRILIKTYLSHFLPRSLANELQTMFWPDFTQTAISDVPDKRLILIGSELTKWTLIPAGTEGYRTAEVTRGGVSTEKISSKTMEVKDQPGLYFVGEVLDVTGHLGGFNFQWAWSSGYAAGLYA